MGRAALAPLALEMATARKEPSSAPETPPPGADVRPEPEAAGGRGQEPTAAHPRLPPPSREVSFVRLLFARPQEEEGPGGDRERRK
jgi:hypothetical protein